LQTAKMTKPDENKMKELKEAFDKMDKDGSGKITATDFIATFKGLGLELSDENAAEMVAFADKDGDKMVTFDEYIAMC